MNLKDLARIAKECDEGVNFVNTTIIATFPQMRLRLTENLLFAKDYFDDGQEKEIVNAIALIDKAIQYKEEQDVKKGDVPGEIV